MSDVTININGGQNQILPNATEAVQKFYGDQYLKERLDADRQGNAFSPDVSRLRTYIYKVEVLSEYIGRLSACKSAKELGAIVIDMVYDDRTTVDSYTMVKKEFIEILQPLVPQVTTGIDNIRYYINEAWENRKRSTRFANN